MEFASCCVILFPEVKLLFDLVYEFRSAIADIALPFRDKNFKLRILRFALSDLQLDNHCPLRLVKCYSCPPPFIAIISY